jgi:hypothetical protein
MDGEVIIDFAFDHSYHLCTLFPFIFDQLMSSVDRNPVKKNSAVCLKKIDEVQVANQWTYILWHF